MAIVTELVDAVRSGDVRTVQRLLGREPALASSTTDDGTSLVFLACTGGHWRVVDALLAAGADVDVFAAAALGETNQLDILLGLDPALATAEAADGETPLHVAARYGQREAAQRLIDGGADATRTNHRGETAAAVARSHGHSSVASLLERR